MPESADKRHFLLANNTVRKTVVLASETELDGIIRNVNRLRDESRGYDVGEDDAKPEPWLSDFLASAKPGDIIRMPVDNRYFGVIACVNALK